MWHAAGRRLGATCRGVRLPCGGAHARVCTGTVCRRTRRSAAGGCACRVRRRRACVVGHPRPTLNRKERSLATSLGVLASDGRLASAMNLSQRASMSGAARAPPGVSCGARADLQPAPLVDPEAGLFTVSCTLTAASALAEGFVLELGWAESYALRVDLGVTACGRTRGTLDDKLRCIDTAIRGNKPQLSSRRAVGPHARVALREAAQLALQPPAQVT